MATLSVRAVAGSTPYTKITAGRHTILIDEPPLFSGGDAAPSPVETLLAALAGALNAIGQYVAREMDLPLRGLSIVVDGDCDAGRFFGRDPSVRAGFSVIRVRIAVDADADAQTLDRWQAEVLSRCPVLDNLRVPVPVRVERKQETIDANCVTDQEETT